MKLKVLEDNNTFIDEYYLGEPGVSYYIEDGDEKILFDIIKELFKNRRKTIANNLQSYFKKKEDVLTFLKDLSIAENKRIEQSKKINKKIVN